MISVIVCTYNRAHYLADTLNHLLHQSSATAHFEVLVINNNSTDDTEGVCQQFSNKNPLFSFRYLVEQSQGLSYARNRGIKEAKGDVLTFIDDDAFAQPDFIQHLQAHFESHPQTMAVGGKIIPQYEDIEPRWMSKYLLPLVAALNMGDQKTPFPKSKFPIGANMSIRREAFEAYGTFDVNLGRKGSVLEGSEEKDLFSRISKSGAPIMYLPQAVVHHIIPAKRVSPQYIKNQAIGIGKSERTRTIQQGRSTFLLFLLGECIKWAGTFVLSLYYLLKLKPAKAGMLLRFRAYVSSGILWRD
jgi:glycosyltransferase involved in cell wall biosynthesis